MEMPGSTPFASCIKNLRDKTVRVLYYLVIFMKARMKNEYFRGTIGAILCGVVLVIITIGSYLLLPAKVHYHVKENYLFTVKEDEATIYLGVLIPTSGPYQEVKNIQISWDGLLERKNNQAVEVIKLTGTLAKGSDQEAIISYDVILPQGRISWVAPIKDIQLMPQPGIESDHPSLKQAASNLTTGSSREDAYRIYKFTSEHMTYTESARDFVSSSALSAYMTGTGMCSEFARLMIALNRAAGIPAQLITGIFMPDLGFYGSSQTQSWEHPGESHAWVEFFTDGSWTIADPTLGSSYLQRLHFGRDFGHYLSYGEYQQEGKTYAGIRKWAASKGDIIAEMHAGLKFIASADTKGISLGVVSSVKKGWDGRWANALLALTITTIILCLLRTRYIIRALIHKRLKEPAARR